MSKQKGLAAKASISQKFLQQTSRRGLEITDPNRNVVGVGFGPKLKEGKVVAPEAARYYVQRKLQRSEVPEHHLLPSQEAGVPTDVIEIGRLACGASMGHSPDHAAHVIQPGSSCGARIGSGGDMVTGTIGAIVSGRRRRFLLSAAHVLARANGYLQGSPILCPAPPDLPETANGAAHGHTTQSSHEGHEEAAMPAEEDFQLAKLSDFEMLSLDAPNKMDAAIAEILSTAQVDASFPGIGKLSKPLPAKPKVGMRVQKVGRATGLTSGRIIDDDATVLIDFPQGFLRFDNQILIQGDPDKAFAWEGDSGAVILTTSTNGAGKNEIRAVGLLVAFSLPDHMSTAADTFCVATDISRVLKQFGVQLDIG